MTGSHDDGASQLVVPALLARIERDPDDAQHQRQYRHVVAEVADDELPGAGLAARLGIDDPRRDRDLAGRRLPVDPEKDDRNRGQQPVDQEIGGSLQDRVRRPVRAAVDVRSAGARRRPAAAACRSGTRRRGARNPRTRVPRHPVRPAGSRTSWPHFAVDFDDHGEPLAPRAEDALFRPAGIDIEAGPESRLRRRVVTQPATNFAGPCCWSAGPPACLIAATGSILTSRSFSVGRISTV